MLKKLLKYDFAGATKIFCILYGIVALLSIIAKIVITFIPDGDFSASLLLVLVPTYFFLMIGLIVAGEIFLIVRFYKNLFTDEGYLTHTLPVKPWQLITSKLITNVSLTLIGFIIICLCALLLLAGEPLTAILSNMPVIAEGAETIFGLPFVPTVILLIILLIVSEISGYLTYFASIAFGQVLIPKHKVIGSFAAYMIFYMAMQIITSIPTFIFTFAQIDTMITATDEMAFVTNFYHFTYFLTLGLSLVSSVIFFFITNLIMKKKLNLD